jgi:hypothetical protein
MTWLWPMTLSLALVLATLNACVFAALLREVGRRIVRTSLTYAALITGDGPPIGSRVPVEISGQDARTLVPLSVARYLGGPLLVLFLSPTCRSCDDLVEAMTPRERMWREIIQMLIVVQAPKRAIDRNTYLAALPDVPVLEDSDNRICEVCNVQLTPLGLLIDPNGRVRMKGIVSTPDQLAGLVEGVGRSMKGVRWGLVPTPEDGSTDGREVVALNG